MYPDDQPIRDPEVLARGQILFDLCETAEQIMRQNIRRRHPELSEAEVEERLVDWRAKRTDPPVEDSHLRPSEKWAKKFGLKP